MLYFLVTHPSLIEHCCRKLSLQLLLLLTGKDNAVFVKNTFSLVCLGQETPNSHGPPPSQKIIQCLASKSQSLPAYVPPAVGVTHSISTPVSAGHTGALHAKCLFFYSDANVISYIKNKFNFFMKK